MKLFSSYVRRHYKIFILMAGCGAILLGVLALYGAPLEGVGYGLLLCAVLGAILLTAGFLRYRNRCRRLEEMLLTLPESLGELPEPKDALEEGYQTLLRELAQKSRLAAADAARERAEAETYYTTWVHQIKTPIAAMELLLQSGEMDGELLRGELFSIEKYVDMALTYQRLGSESTDLVLGEYALDPIIRRAVKEYARLFIAKKLSLTFTPTDLTVLTDEKWLGFVLGQVLSNAVKYTDRGGVSIYAQGETLIVEDTGMGIPESELPRVFERSFTGMNGREAERTTGLGLYLCKRTCDMLGHGIRLSSAVGRGTRVLLDLGRGESPRE